MFKEIRINKIITEFIVMGGFALMIFFLNRFEVINLSSQAQISVTLTYLASVVLRLIIYGIYVFINGPADTKKL